MVKKWRRFLLLVAYVTLIFVGSSIPRLAPPGPEFFLKDKIAHFVEYFVLGVLLFRSIGSEVGRVRWAAFGFMFVVAATVGALDEIYQSFIPGRDMNIGDWFSDMAGAAVGIGLLVLTRSSSIGTNGDWKPGEGEQV
jgi:VanZ family protein